MESLDSYTSEYIKINQILFHTEIEYLIEILRRSNICIARFYICVLY